MARSVSGGPGDSHLEDLGSVDSGSINNWEAECVMGEALDCVFALSLSLFLSSLYEKVSVLKPQ